TGKMLSPQTGIKKNLVILVDFPNKKFGADHNTGYFTDLLFGNGNSMKTYYSEQSYGKLTVAGTVLGPYTSAHNIEYYASDGNTDPRGKTIDTGESGNYVPIYQ